MKVHKIGVVIKRDQIEYLFYLATIRFYVALSVDLKRQIWAKRLQYIPQANERLIDIALGVQLDQAWFFRRMNVQAHLWNLLRIIVSHSAGGDMRPHRCVRYLNELYRLGLSANESRLRESAQGDKWSFCLTAGKIGPRIRREHEQETAPEPCIGL